MRRSYSDAASPAVAGRQALVRASTAMERALAVRRAAGSDDGFVDVSYPRLAADPVATVGDVYARLGRSPDPDAEEAMRRWAVANPQHKHGPQATTWPYVDRFAPFLEAGPGSRADRTPRPRCGGRSGAACPSGYGAVRRRRLPSGAP